MATLAMPAFVVGGVVPVAEAEVPVICRGHVATIVGTNGNDVLVGTPSRDVIAALDGEDRIFGRGGSDVICAGPGSDLLFGDKGRDRIFAASGILYGGRGDDHLEASGKAAGFRGGPGDDVLVNRTGLANFVAEPGHNTVRSLVAAHIQLIFDASPVGVHVDLVKGTVKGQGLMTLDVAEGSDFDVFASPHADVLRGSDGNDIFDEVGGGDFVSGRAGDDILSTSRAGGHGSVVLHGGSGSDLLSFAWRSGQFNGGAGDDQIYARVAPGSSAIGAGSGDNVLYLRLFRPGASKAWHHARVDLEASRIDADGHVTPLTGVFSQLHVATGGSALRWTVNGTEGDDWLSGQAGSNGPWPPVVEHGRGGNDVLRTSNGNDTVWGGPGIDRASTGGGLDTCYSVETPRSCETISP